MTTQTREVDRSTSGDFFSGWLAASERNEEDVQHAPVVARGRDLLWVETPHEHQVAMLVGRQVGFPTQGTNLCKVVIPVGHHTGRQRHGEEAIHVLSGAGAAVVDGRRYDIRSGTTLHVPYRSEHQLFNLGTDDLTYVSAGAMDLDLYVKLGRLVQLEPKGANEPDIAARLPAEDGQFDAEGRRIALHLDDAPDEQQRRERSPDHGSPGRVDDAPDEQQRRERSPDHGSPGCVDHSHGGRGATDKPHRHGPTDNPHRHGAILVLMGGGESPSDERNGFVAVSASMTNIFEEVPHSSSHCHSHTEAVLYVLEGVGYSEIDGKHYDWEAGDAVHVPPKMTRHEHFNPSDNRTRTLRIEYGIRYFYEPLWKGYAKVEHRETAIARP